MNFWEAFPNASHSLYNLGKLNNLSISSASEILIPNFNLNQESVYEPHEF